MDTTPREDLQIETSKQIQKTIMYGMKDMLINKKEFLDARMNGKMRDYYRILENPLGKGAYGEVRKVIFKAKGVNDK